MISRSISNPRFQAKLPVLGLLCWTIVAVGGGCQFAPTASSLRWPWSKKPPVMPDKILAVWSDSVLHQAGQPGIRGFGGRIYFYQSNGSDPIKVDGGVAVYVFDADVIEPQKQQPLRKYVFTSEQLAEHMSKTQLGPSYSLWLPWDEVGGQSRRLSLITRYEGREGGTVLSDPAIKLLPGMTTLESSSPSDRQANAASGMQMVGHQQHHQEPVVSSEQVLGRGIETIDLPPSFRQHLHDRKKQPAEQLQPPSISLPERQILPDSPPAAPQKSMSQTVIEPEATVGLVTEVHDSRSRSAGRFTRHDRIGSIREGKSIPNAH